MIILPENKPFKIYVGEGVVTANSFYSVCGLRGEGCYVVSDKPLSTNTGLGIGYHRDQPNNDGYLCLTSEDGKTSKAIPFIVGCVMQKGDVLNMSA